jgi:chloramphenicol O-acetyltransferase
MLLKLYYYTLDRNPVYSFKIEAETLLAKNQITENAEYFSSAYIWKSLRASPYTFSLEMNIKNRIIDKRKDNTYEYDIVNKINIYQIIFKGINLDLRTLL